MANGGYAFKKVNGAFDGSTTGVNNAGAKIGGQVLRSLFDDGVLPEGVDYGVMDGAMANGEVAMVINGHGHGPVTKEQGAISLSLQFQLSMDKLHQHFWVLLP